MRRSDSPASEEATVFFWPFKRKPPEPLTPAQLRDRLIEAAASGSIRKLSALCRQYKEQVAANVDLMCKVPEGMAEDPASLERYVQCLGTVAQCLASQCGAPELWNTLCGTPDDSPLTQWDRWYGQLRERMDRLEFDALIAEARDFIQRAQTLRGPAARQNEAFLNGRLGELLFHSGQVGAAEEPFRAAQTICREMDDREGQRVYLNNLLEVHRYLGNASEAVRTGEELIGLMDKHGVDSNSLKKRIELMRRGEPLCRVVCVRDGAEWELGELSSVAEGRYEFQFRRNRLPLQKAETLVRQGNELASSGNLADALEKYQDATETDPYDPDPVYQSGTCLLELGACGKAREAFEEVEQLAPGWFRCRSDRWLAASLEDGTVSDEEFRILRALEDGGLPPQQALQIAKQAVERHPSFAPLFLILGDLHRDRDETARAIACYRNGLELVGEPDLESRLLCALAGLLPKDSTERSDLVRRAVSLNGSLVAQATAALMHCQ
jgi:tetratricopeptide (TPR) repeat protein